MQISKFQRKNAGRAILINVGHVDVVFQLSKYLGLNIELGLKITDCKIDWHLEGSVMISSLWIFEIQSSYSRHVPI